MEKVYNQDLYENLLFNVLDQNTLRNLLAYKFVHSNKKFYQYRSFDINGYNLQNLKNNQIYLNNPQNFNDPFDCFFTANFNDYIRDELLKSKEKLISELDDNFNLSDEERYEAIKYLESDELFNQLNITQIITKQDKYQDLENLKKTLQNVFKVSCFSTDNTNLLMWSHYAKNHQGFCIEYDISKIEMNHTFRSNFWPVIYKTKTLDLLLLKKTKKIIDNNPTLTPYLRIIIGTIKPKDWCYEKEWRFIQRNIDNDLYTMPIKPSCVYLGAKISSDNKQIIKEILREQSIPCKQMKLKPGYFSLEALSDS